MYEFLIDNREIIKLFYGLVVGLICFAIVLKTDRLFRISMHQGIRYLRNAFFFYGIAFVIRYLVGGLIKYELFYIDGFLINMAFEFFLIMAGFFLLYSLLWKKIERHDEDYSSSLFNPKISIFYLMALIFTAIDYLWKSHTLMFFSQIVLFLFASIISYSNYTEKGSKHKFPKFYFIAMFLSFVAWALNALAGMYFNWNNLAIIGTYLLNTIIFILFLWGVVEVTGGK
ncbi:MAG: hypothetical protein AABX88_02340 [Nanoarchaeota archaeon]